MRIIIVGCGNVGATLAEQLSKEGHNITIIDTREVLTAKENRNVYSGYLSDKRFLFWKNAGL